MTGRLGGDVVGHSVSFSGRRHQRGDSARGRRNIPVLPDSAAQELIIIVRKSKQLAGLAADHLRVRRIRAARSKRGAEPDRVSSPGRCPIRSSRSIPLLVGEEIPPFGFAFAPVDLRMLSRLVVGCPIRGVVLRFFCVDCAVPWLTGWLTVSRVRVPHALG